MPASKREEKICGNAEVQLKIGIFWWRSEEHCFLIEEYKDFESLCQRNKRSVRDDGLKKLL